MQDMVDTVTADSTYTITLYEESANQAQRWEKSFPKILKSSKWDEMGTTLFLKKNIKNIVLLSMKFQKTHCFLSICT